MGAAIYLAIAFATASLVLSIVAFAVVITNPYELSRRLDRLERKFARMVGWVEGLTGQTLGRKDEEVA